VETVGRSLDRVIVGEEIDRVATGAACRA